MKKDLIFKNAFCLFLFIFVFISSSCITDMVKGFKAGDMLRKKDYSDFDLLTQDVFWEITYSSHHGKLDVYKANGASRSAALESFAIQALSFIKKVNSDSDINIGLFPLTISNISSGYTTIEQQLDYIDRYKNEIIKALNDIKVKKRIDFIRKCNNEGFQKDKYDRRPNIDSPLIRYLIYTDNSKIENDFNLLKSMYETFMKDNQFNKQHSLRSELTNLVNKFVENDTISDYESKSDIFKKLLNNLGIFCQTNNQYYSSDVSQMYFNGRYISRDECRMAYNELLNQKDVINLKILAQILMKEENSFDLNNIFKDFSQSILDLVYETLIVEINNYLKNIESIIQKTIDDGSYEGNDPKILYEVAQRYLEGSDKLKKSLKKYYKYLEQSADFGYYRAICDLISIGASATQEHKDILKLNNITYLDLLNKVSALILGNFLNENKDKELVALFGYYFMYNGGANDINSAIEQFNEAGNKYSEELKLCKNILETYNLYLDEKTYENFKSLFDLLFDWDVNSIVLVNSEYLVPQRLRIIFPELLENIFSDSENSNYVKKTQSDFTAKIHTVRDSFWSSYDKYHMYDKEEVNLKKTICEYYSPTLLERYNFGVQKLLNNKQIWFDLMDCTNPVLIKT